MRLTTVCRLKPSTSKSRSPSCCKEIEALALLPRTDARDREIESLRRRLETVRAELYASLTPWQRVLVARHPDRPGLEDFIQRLFPASSRSTATAASPTITRS